MKLIHPNSKHSNRCYDWFTSDTKKLFAENLKNRKHELSKNGWLDKKISYEFDKFGFRKNLNKQDKKDLLFLGCSFTFGIGIDYQSSFTNLVCDQLKMNNVNWALPGGSNDSAFTLLNEYLEISTPTMVILVSPSAYRFELFSIKNNLYWSHSFGSNCLRGEPSLFEHVDAPLHFFNERYLNQNKIKNQLAIENICQKNNIKFYMIDVEEFPIFDYGRDLLHPGTKSNLSMSKKILNLVLN